VSGNVILDFIILLDQLIGQLFSIFNSISWRVVH